MHPRFSLTAFKQKDQTLFQVAKENATCYITAETSVFPFPSTNENNDVGIVKSKGLET